MTSTKQKYFALGSRLQAHRREGESPVSAVTRDLSRRLNADVALWFSETTDSGEIYSAHWYDRLTETFHDEPLEITR